MRKSELKKVILEVLSEVNYNAVKVGGKVYDPEAEEEAIVIDKSNGISGIRKLMKYDKKGYFADYLEDLSDDEKAKMQIVAVKYSDGTRAVLDVNYLNLPPSMSASKQGAGRKGIDYSFGTL